MASETVRQPRLSPADLERIELAQKALFQADALLPIAQRLADTSGYEPDVMLGLLGRIRQMSDVAMDMLQGIADGVEPVAETLYRKRVEVLGRGEVAAG